MPSLVRRLLDRAAGQEGARLRARLADAFEVAVPDDEIQARLAQAHAEVEQRQAAGEQP